MSTFRSIKVKRQVAKQKANAYRIINKNKMIKLLTTIVNRIFSFATLLVILYVGLLIAEHLLDAKLIPKF